MESYSTFNEFFARRLIAGARPIASLEDDAVLISPADCRILTFPSVEITTKIWLKVRKKERKEGRKEGKKRKEKRSRVERVVVERKGLMVHRPRSKERGREKETRYHHFFECVR